MCDDLSNYTQKVGEELQRVSAELNKLGDVLMNTDGVCENELDKLGVHWNTLASGFNGLLIRVQMLSFISSITETPEHPVDPTLN